MSIGERYRCSTIAVVKDGKIAYARAYGNANLETKTPATPQMRYSIGSISKQFTATAVLLLADAHAGQARRPRRAVTGHLHHSRFGAAED